MVDIAPEFRKYNTIEEISVESGYVSDAVAGEKDFKVGLGYYEFKEEVRCALHHCHTDHLKGYVVLLQDGRVVNIGNRCGLTAFGDLFKKELSRIDKFRDLQAIKETLADYIRQTPEIRTRVDTLCSASFVVDRVEQALSSFGSHPLSGRLYEMALRKDGRVFRARRRTESEFEIAQAQYPGKRDAELWYTEEEIGRIVGLSILLADPKEMLREKVVRTLSKLKKLSGEENALTLRKLSRELGEMSGCLVRVEELLTEAQRFFTSENFSLIGHLARSEADKQAVREFDWDFNLQQKRLRERKTSSPRKGG